MSFRKGDIEATWTVSDKGIREHLLRLVSPHLLHHRVLLSHHPGQGTEGDQHLIRPLHQLWSCSGHPNRQEETKALSSKLSFFFFMMMAWNG